MILLRLFWEFFKTGLFAVGGGMATLPFLYDMSARTGWFTQARLADMIAVSESTPGPIMVNLATYVGNTQAGLPGAILATLAVVMPSFIIILLVMAVLKAALKNPYVQAVLRGLKPCIIGIILATGLYMVLHNCLGSVRNVQADAMAVILTVILAAVYFIPAKMKKQGLSPVMLIGISAVLGMLVYGF